VSLQVAMQPQRRAGAAKTHAQYDSGRDLDAAQAKSCAHDLTALAQARGRSLCRCEYRGNPILAIGALSRETSKKREAQVALGP